MAKLSPTDWQVEIDNGLEFREKFAREDAWKQLENDYLNDIDSNTALGSNLAELSAWLNYHSLHRLNQRFPKFIPYVKENDILKVVTIYPCRDINREIKRKEGTRWVKIK